MKTVWAREGRGGAWLRAGGLGGLLAAAFVGCASVEKSAPPVSPSMVEVGGKQGASPEALARGRDLYITKCASCHVPEPVNRYPESLWVNKILPSMSKQANLSVGEIADLRSYVLAAHRVMTLPPTPASPQAAPTSK